MPNKFHEILFTQSVKSAQTEYGSRGHYAKFEGGAAEFGGFGDSEKDFIEQRDSFYLSTASEDGHPYIQFRGGPMGFWKVLDEKTLGYAGFVKPSVY